MLRAKRRRTRMHDKKGNPLFNTMNSTPLQSVYKNQNTHLKQLTECRCKVCEESGCGNECSFCGCSNCYSYNNIPNSKKCCKGAPQRNPLPGYRRQLVFNDIIGKKGDFHLKCMEEDGEKGVTITTNNIYKDNYARICGSFRKGLGIENDGNTVEELGHYNKDGEFIPQWENANGEKTCGYSQTKPRIQNRNGWINNKYNYSTKQYLERRCRTFKKQAFNFLSNQPIKGKDGSNCSEFLTNCFNSNLAPNNGSASRKCKSNCSIVDCSCCKLICINSTGIDCSYNSICAQTAPNCAKKGYTISEATSSNCKAVYKRSNPRFSTQGAVSGGSRINRLKYQTQLKSQSVIRTIPTTSTGSNRNISYMGTPYAKVNSTGGVNATNGAYPVSLYRSTYPRYKSRLSGLCIRNMDLTLNLKPQRCPMPEELPPCQCKMLQTIPQRCRQECDVCKR